MMRLRGPEDAGSLHFSRMVGPAAWHYELRSTRRCQPHDGLGPVPSLPCWNCPPYQHHGRVGLPLPRSQLGKVEPHQGRIGRIGGSGATNCTIIRTGGGLFPLEASGKAPPTATYGTRKIFLDVRIT